MKIILFGASVTAQGKESGYFTHLSRLCEKDGISIARHAYSACHFNDAGFFKFEEILKTNGQICLFDWNTTGMGRYETEKLVFVLNQLWENKILPAFLIFPRSDTNLHKNREAEDQVVALSKDCNIPLLDIRHDINPDLHLRDNVHTNEVGAIEYATKVKSFIDEMIPSYPSRNLQLPLDLNHNFTNLCVSCSTTIEECKPLLLRISNVGLRPEIAIHIKVGPYSPIIQISVDNSIIKTLNLFDQWCHFEREMYYQILAPYHISNTSRKVEVNVLSELPDRSITRDPGFEHSGELKVPLIEVFAADLYIEKIWQSSDNN